MSAEKRKHIVASIFQSFSEEPVFSYIKKSILLDEFYADVVDDEVTTSQLLYLNREKINTFDDKKVHGIKWNYFVFIRFCFLWKEVIPASDKVFLNKLVQEPKKFLVVRRLLPFMSLDRAINVVLFEFMESYFYFGEGQENILRVGMDNLVAASTTKIRRIALGVLPVFVFMGLLFLKVFFYPAELVVSGAIIHFWLAYMLGLAFGDLFVFWRYIDSSILVNEVSGKSRYPKRFLLPFYRFGEQFKFIARGFLISKKNIVVPNDPNEISPFVLKAKEFCAGFLTFEDYLLADAVIVPENKLPSTKRVKI